MRSLDPTLTKLARAQTAFFRAADAVPPEHWNSRPSADEWSAAELVAHLVMVERAVVGGADRISQKTPKPVPFYKRFHIPIWVVESRLIRRKTPIPLDQGLIGAKEEMLAELRAARERTLAFMEETKNRDLSRYRWKHAFLGMLNIYEWFEMLAAHEIRHTKQMKEIAAHFPKVVGIS
ncbi:MAG: DinB family protein [Candidatus Acidiferrum sp.]